MSIFTGKNIRDKCFMESNNIQSLIIDQIIHIQSCLVCRVKYVLNKTFSRHGKARGRTANIVVIH